MKAEWKSMDSVPKDNREFVALWERRDGTWFIALTNQSQFTVGKEQIYSFIGYSRFGTEFSIDGFAKPIKWDYLPDVAS